MPRDRRESAAAPCLANHASHEHHKGDMRSVALKLYEKIQAGGTIDLFKSYRPDFADGMQLRGFIHVGDSVDVMLWRTAIATSTSRRPI